VITALGHRVLLVDRIQLVLIDDGETRDAHHFSASG
jgi:hypothetical protein